MLFFLLVGLFTARLQEPVLLRATVVLPGANPQANNPPAVARCYTSGFL
jgi:hypothetical protein